MSDHPLECTFSHRAEQSQLEFARRTIKFMSPRPDRSFKVSHRGLIVSGETEASLARVIELLKSIYGQELCVGELTIRYRRGEVVEEPYMGVRVLCSATHFEAVRDDLASRGAMISDAELSPPIGVIRATASLARLLGYSQDLAKLTETKAREVIWLSHYAPVPASNSRQPVQHLLGVAALDRA
jgi:hypothetical protein